MSVNIALVHYRYDPSKASGGGMDIYFADLAQAFAERGDKVDVWTYEQAPATTAPPNVSVREVPFRIPWWSSRKIAFHTELVRELNPQDYDLVLGTMRTSKLDINVNGGTHLGYVRGVYKRLRHTDLIPIFFERRALRGAALVVAHSQKIAAEIIRAYGIHPAKVHVLYPPSNESRYHLGLRAQRSAWVQKYQRDPRKFGVLFPSTNHEIKGLAVLLEAFAQLPEVEYELLIAGAPVESSYRLKANTRYLGHVKKIEELFVACDATVMPSHYDGFGLVVTESIACGTPVIVSKQTGASEILEATGERYGVVLENRTATEIARQIRRVKERRDSFRFGPEFLPEFLKNHGLTPRQHVEALLHLTLTGRGLWAPSERPRSRPKQG